MLLLKGLPSFTVPSVRPLRRGRLAKRFASVLAFSSDVFAQNKATPAASEFDHNT